MKRILAFSIATLMVFSGCQSVFLGQTSSSSKSGGNYEPYYDEGSYYAMEADYEESYAMVASTDDVLSVEDEQKIIKTGSLDLHVDDVQDTVPAIEEALSEWEGRVLYSSVNRGSSSYYADMQVRVAAEHFEAAMDGLKEMAVYVDSEYTNADDITEAYADLEARLRNAEEEEAAYLDILTRAGTMSDVLEVTRAISDVRYEIESYESQLSNYDTRVAYSTIDLSLSEDAAVVSITEKWRPVQVVKDAFGEWIGFLQWGVDTLIYVAIFGWPVLLIWLWRRKRKR